MAGLADSTLPRFFVTTSYTNEGKWTTGLLRNYPGPEGENAALSRFRVKEALKATTAAPTFLPPLIKDGQVYHDGGLLANNPACRWAQVRGC